jgi:lipoprotein-anchoring transpeptidase ErfK/SrfK
VKSKIFSKICHLGVTVMKNLFSLNWVRYSKTLLASVALSISIFSISSEGTLAQSKPQVIKQAIANLQTTEKRWIQINLSEQKLIAWEGKKPVFAVIVSTGKKSTPTRTGVFQIQTKLRKTRMRGRDYDVPNVPYTMFYQGNYAIHGAYWHRRFGTPVSHGCVNVAPNHAKWLFDWASIGTPVVVHR